jgi:hypothetical protein
MEQIFRMPHFVQILEYCYFNEIDSKWSWRSSISNQRFISFNSMNLINFFTYYVYIKQSMYSVVIVVPRRLSQNCLSRNKLWEKVSAFTLLEGARKCILRILSHKHWRSRCHFGNVLLFLLQLWTTSLQLNKTPFVILRL